MSKPNKKVLLVGWDSADWKAINPLLDSGKMPNLEQLVKGGIIGNLATLYPVLSPMLWTSIATGKRPFKHGIHGFAEPDPHSGGIRPITNLSRKTKAVWNILSQNDKKCIVIGWWPSHPAEPLPNGVMVSNHFQRAPHPDPKKPWPLPPGAVHPERLAETLAELRFHPGELEGNHILPFIPKAAEINQEKDRRLEGLVKTLADCTTIQAAATHLIQTEPWDFMAVYFDAIDHFGHGFMKYHPPRQKWIPEKDFELYSGVIEAAYRYHDMMLGVLMAMAGPETTVLLMSDHGFHPDHLRPSAIPMEPAGPAVEHRHYGIFALQGPGIKTDDRVYGATVLDICPTLLTLFGLPVGEDMDGKPLVTVYADPPKVKTIPTWDTVAGADGQHPPDTRLDAGDAKEALKQLEALGYIQPLPEDTEKAIAETAQELQYNLACAYSDAQMDAKAAEIFAELWRARPEEHRYGAQTISAKIALGHFAEARVLLEELRANRRKYAREAAAQLKEKREALKDKKTEDLKPGEQMELARLTAKASLSPAPMLQLEATILASENKFEEAMEILRKLEKAGCDRPEFHLRLARCCLGLKQWTKAEKLFNQALKLDPDNARAHLGIAQTSLAQRHNFQAAGAALKSIGLLYHNPLAHFVLGTALHRLGKLPRAVEALQVCVRQNPNFLTAHRKLALIYQNRLKDPARSQEHEALFLAGLERLKAQRQAAAHGAPAVAPPATESRAAVSGTTAVPAFDPAKLAPPRPDARFVTIVSGLPRSGTSLMMQMLDAGGIPALQDDHRPADADNPRGYFEFAPARNLRMEGSWMPHAQGRALKLVAQLLPFLPPGQEYRVIFMERTLEEVLASQSVMLKRRGREGAALTPEKLQAVYQQQLARGLDALQRPDCQCLRVAHSDCIRDPRKVAKRVAEFLGLPLKLKGMASVIDPKLHRQKKGTTKNK